MYSDDPGDLELPIHPGHHIDGIGAAYTYGNHPEASRVGRVGVGPDHHPAGECIVFKYYLVDDPGPGLPEIHAVAAGCAAQEFIDLGIGPEGCRHILDGPVAGTYEMVAVDAGGHRHTFLPGVHELQDRHLRGRILHRHPVWPEEGIILSPAESTNVLSARKMPLENLLGICQRMIRAFHRLTN